MKRHAKAIILTLITAITASALSGCTRKSGSDMIIESYTPDQEEISATVTFFGYRADAPVAIETALHDFMNIHPDIKVTYEGFKGQTYWDAFEKRDASGNLDDIFNVDHEHLMTLCAEGKVADLSGLATIENYNGLARTQFTEEDGSIYFLPISVATCGLYVNLDLLEQNGLEPPSGLQEFTEVCDYFAARGVSPVIINNSDSFRGLVVAKSLYPIYRKENPTAEIHKLNENPARLAGMLRPGIELASFMLERGWIDGEEALVTSQLSDDLALFAEGTRPFMITVDWASPRLAALEPDFAYAIYPLPVLDTGSVLVMEMTACISINAESPCLKEALQFAEFLTQTDVIWQYCNNQSTYTPLRDERIPPDSATRPFVPGRFDGEMVISSDYSLDLPLDSALQECGKQMMQGMDVEKAMALLSELLVLQH